MRRIDFSTRPALTGAILMVGAGALFAGVNTLMQYGAMTLQIAPSKLAFWQYLMAFLCALPWLFGRNAIRLTRTHLPWHLARVGLAACGVQLWVMGLAHVPIWQAIALVMLSPFFVTAGAGLFLREKTTFIRWMAVAIGFVGGMIILAPWSDSFTIHAFYPIAAAALWAGSSLLTKHMTGFESAETLTFYLLLLLTPINAALAWDSGWTIGLDISGGILLAAGLLTALAQYALAKAYSIADAAYLQPFDHIKLPFNVGLGLIVFGFVPPGSMWLGSALIVGASFYLLRLETRPKSTAPA